jgi:hypothetical protein
MITLPTGPMHVMGDHVLKRDAPRFKNARKLSSVGVTLFTNHIS